MAKLTKDQLFAALADKGVSTTGDEKVAELQELAEANDIAIETDTATNVSASEKVAVDVLNKRGGIVRTYSKELHGKGFQDLAKEYAAKIGGSVA